jgi:hypothetical protein
LNSGFRFKRYSRTMQFTVDGKRYRIGFHHDPPGLRKWATHVKHRVELRQRFETGPDAPTELWCADCALKLAPLTLREQARNTHCKIVRLEASGVTVLATSSGKLNVKAGDRFDREAGRRAALNAALSTLPRDFREAAWKAYIERPKEKARAAA